LAGSPTCSAYRSHRHSCSGRIKGSNDGAAETHLRHHPQPRRPVADPSRRRPLVPPLDRLAFLLPPTFRTSEGGRCARRRCDPRGAWCDQSGRIGRVRCALFGRSGDRLSPRIPAILGLSHLVIASTAEPNWFVHESRDHGAPLALPAPERLMKGPHVFHRLPPVFGRIRAIEWVSKNKARHYRLTRSGRCR